MSRAAEGSRRRKRALADAMTGVVGSLVSLWTFYPIEVWKTNLQAGSTDSKQRSLFQGCTTKTLHTASSNFCYFYLYSWIFSNWKRFHGQRSNQLHPATRLMLSAVAAMLNTMITLPLDVISSKQLTQREEETSDDKMKHDAEKVDNNQESSTEWLQEENSEEVLSHALSFRSTKDTSLEVLEETSESWSSLWKGLTPALLLCSNPSINYTVFDIAKNQVLAKKDHQTSSSLSMPEAFVLGLFAKFVATIATYPLIRAKVILMVTNEKSLLGSLIRSYNQGGIKGLYKGCDWQLLHTVLKSALMMMVREKITVSTHQFLVGQSSATGSQ